MKRRLFKLVMFIFFGAVVNVAVAWGCAIWSSLSSHYPIRGDFLVIDQLDESPLKDWFLLPDKTSGLIRKREARLQGFGLQSTRITWTKLTPDLLFPFPKYSMHSYAAGWPLQVLRCEWTFYDIATNGRDGSSRPKQNKAIRFAPAFLKPKLVEQSGVPAYARPLPLLPIWWSFAFNTIFSAVFIWLLLLGMAALCRVVRISLGYSVKCGNDLSSENTSNSPERSERGNGFFIKEITKYRLVKLFLLLFLGAIVNVSVAGGSALIVGSSSVANRINTVHEWEPWLGFFSYGRWRNTTGERLSRSFGEEGGTYPNMPTEEFVPSWGIDAFNKAGFWSTRELISPVLNGSRNYDTYIIDGRGWPMLSMWGGVRQPWEFYHSRIVDAYRKELGSVPRLERFYWAIGLNMNNPDKHIAPEDWRLLPLRPLWSGFAVNTIFYATIVWLIAFAPFTLRRYIRQKRGRCIKCAYDLRGGSKNGCPECGWQEDDAKELETTTQSTQQFNPTSRSIHM